MYVFAYMFTVSLTVNSDRDGSSFMEDIFTNSLFSNCAFRSNR